MSSLLTVSTQTPLKFGLGSETVRSGAGSAACATAGSRKASRPTTPAPAASQARRHFSHEPTAGTPSSLIPFFPPVRHGRGKKTDVQRQSSDFIKYIGRSKACQVQTTNARVDGVRGRADRPVSPRNSMRAGCAGSVGQAPGTHSRLPWNEPAFQYVEEREGDQAQG